MGPHTLRRTGQTHTHACAQGRRLSPPAPSSCPAHGEEDTTRAVWLSPSRPLLPAEWPQQMRLERSRGVWQTASGHPPVHAC